MTLDSIADQIGTVEHSQESDDGDRFVSDESNLDRPEDTAEDMWNPRG